MSSLAFKIGVNLMGYKSKDDYIGWNKVSCDPRKPGPKSHEHEYNTLTTS
jgi:hypothetical protein